MSHDFVRIERGDERPPRSRVEPKPFPGRHVRVGREVFAGVPYPDPLAVEPEQRLEMLDRSPAPLGAAGRRPGPPRDRHGQDAFLINGDAMVAARSAKEFDRYRFLKEVSGELVRRLFGPNPSDDLSSARTQEDHERPENA